MCDGEILGLDCLLFETVQVKVFRPCLSAEFSFGGKGIICLHTIQLIKDSPSKGVFPYKKERGVHCTPRVFILKRSPVGIFEVPFKELSWNTSSHNHKTGSWYLLGVKNISSHTHKTRSWYLLGVKNISSHTHKTRSWYLLEVKTFQATPTKQDLGTS